jgi:hypothetical protein
MKNKGPERRRFATAQEAVEHAKKFGNRGSYRFGTDSIVFTPAKESTTAVNNIIAKKPFDPGMDDPKFDRGFHPGYRK